VAQRGRQRRLAEATGTDQSSGDGDRFLVRAGEEQLSQRRDAGVR